MNIQISQYNQGITKALYKVCANNGKNYTITIVIILETILDLHKYITLDSLLI